MAHRDKSITGIYERLSDCYGRQYWWPLFRQGASVYEPVPRPLHRSPEHQWEIALGALLTQNTAWANVEKALDNLAARGGWDPSRLLSLGLDELAQEIRSAGTHHQKARKIKAFLEAFPEADLSVLKDMSLEVARQSLLTVWGIGPETADSILLYALGRPVFVVDAYTRRIFSRLGLIQGGTYEEIQARFHDELDPEPLLFQEYHALIVRHAKLSCRSKARCRDCILAEICEFPSFNPLSVDQDIKKASQI